MAKHFFSHLKDDALSHFLKHPCVQGIQDKPQEKHTQVKKGSGQDACEIIMT